MAFEWAKTAIGEAALRQGLRYLAGDPEKNLLNLARWAEAVARDDKHKEYARNALRVFSEPDNPWRKLALRIFRQVSPAVREKLGVNFFVHAGMLGIPKQREMGKKYGIHVPWAMLIDPTGRCNLRCRGCWAAEYDRSLDMDYATLDRVIREAEDLGIHFIVVSGGEPTVRMDDLVSLAEKHDESVFHVFTNGTLIDEAAARKFGELGNVTFAISVDGFEEATDTRRGKGVFSRVMRAMDNLKNAGVVFGFSATYTRDNTEEVGSDAFIDFMIDKGCVLGWYFTYVPVGGGPDLEYMATVDQRMFMYNQVRRWRQEKPVFVIDFWNDGELAGGCIAGGRNYFHINAMGDVEPCAFVHYANVNIKNTSLVEALGCPLFRSYQDRQPFNHNLMRPCPIIDNPWALEEIVTSTGAYSTQNNRISTADLCRPLHSYARAWGEKTDPIWFERHPAEAAATRSCDDGEK